MSLFSAPLSVETQNTVEEEKSSNKIVRAAFLNNGTNGSTSGCRKSLLIFEMLEF